MSRFQRTHAASNRRSACPPQDPQGELLKHDLAERGSESVPPLLDLAVEVRARDRHAMDDHEPAGRVGATSFNAAITFRFPGSSSRSFPGVASCAVRNLFRTPVFRATANNGGRT